MTLMNYLSSFHNFLPAHTTAWSQEKHQRDIRVMNNIDWWSSISYGYVYSSSNLFTIIHINRITINELPHEEIYVSYEKK